MDRLKLEIAYLGALDTLMSAINERQLQDAIAQPAPRPELLARAEGAGSA